MFAANNDLTAHKQKERNFKQPNVFTHTNVPLCPIGFCVERYYERRECVCVRCVSEYATQFNTILKRIYLLCSKQQQYGAAILV